MTVLKFNSKCFLAISDLQIKIRNSLSGCNPKNTFLRVIFIETCMGSFYFTLKYADLSNKKLKPILTDL